MSAESAVADAVDLNVALFLFFFLLILHFVLTFSLRPFFSQNLPLLLSVSIVTVAAADAVVPWPKLASTTALSVIEKERERGWR